MRDDDNGQCMGQQSGASVLGMALGANQCVREQTPKEALARLIERKDKELSDLRQLHAALPDEMHWGAANALRKLIYKEI